MSMWDKFVNKVKEIKQDNKKMTVFEEIVGQEYQIDSINNIWKLNPGQLIEVVQKYDIYVQSLKKGRPENGEDEITMLQQKWRFTEEERKKLIDERNELNTHLEELQKSLNLEIANRLNLKMELDYVKNQNHLLNQKLIQYEQQIKGIQPQQQQQQGNEEYESQVKINMNPDSELLMFTNQEELQKLRNIFELIQSDAVILLNKLKKENDGNLQNIASHRKQSNEKSKKHSQDQDEEQDEEEEEEEEQQEEEYTIQDLFTNTWDSLSQFNENVENLKKKLEKFLKEKENINSKINEVNSQTQKELEKVQEELRQLTKEYNVVTKAKKLMEDDFLKLQDKYKIEKEKAVNFEQESQEQSHSFHGKMEEYKKLETSYKNLLEEKQQLQSEISKIHQMYQSNEEENRQKEQEMLEKIDYLSQENEQFEKQIKHKEETHYMDIKQKENQIIQEKLKVDQITKEMKQLDEKYNKAKRDLEEQVLANDQGKLKIQQIEEKRVDEKKKIKDQKQKLLEVMNQVKDLTKKLADKDKQMEQLNLHQQQIQEQTDIQNQIKRCTLQKDMQISNLQIVQEQSEKQIKDLDKLNQKLSEELKTMKEEQQRNVNIIKSLQEKRELALQEIKKLTFQIELMKQSSNPATNQKINQIQKLVDKAVELDQSFNQEMQQQILNTVESMPVLERIDSNQRERDERGRANSVKQIDLSCGQICLSNSNSKQLQQFKAPQLNQINNHIQIKELQSLSVIKRDLEILYKEYINVAFSIENNKEMLKLERKFNDSIKKTQDLMDQLEDQL